MNVLASVHLYPPVHNCGSEYVLHGIFKYLISKGHHCRVILHQSEMHQIPCPYIHEGVEVFGATGELDAYRWSNCLITHLDFSQYTTIIAKTVDKPLVHLIHNDISYNCIRNAFKKNYVIYNSNWIKKSLNYSLPSMVLHPPCDVNYYDTGEQDRDAITLISLNKNKGGEIFYQVAEAMPDKKFIGVVGSYDEQIIKDLPNVEIVPNSPDILSTYKRTRILLMPSAYESWGRTATEAMCSGIPVICTPTPGLLENCGEAGIFVGKPLINPPPGEPCVDRGTVQEWVKAIRSLDNPDTYRKYSVLSKSRAGELDPLKELEELEQFLINAAYAQ